MISVAMKIAAAAVAAAGLAYTSAETALSGAAYGDEDRLTALTEAALVEHAAAVFQRADRDQSGALDNDEYAALSIVSAELARLNGFVVIESADGFGTLALSGSTPSALSQIEHVRVDAVARSTFYQHAGDDGLMSEQEYADAQRAVFDVADFNRNGVLKRGELKAFAHRQALLSAGA